MKDDEEFAGHAKAIDLIYKIVQNDSKWMLDHDLFSF